MPVIPALERWTQEEKDFKVILHGIYQVQDQPELCEIFSQNKKKRVRITISM